jgi:predicted ATPase
MLLVLDNFEQVIPSAELVAGLISRAPYIKVLVTSRSVLHLSGEYQYPLPGLELPAIEETQVILPEELPSLSSYPAVALFIQSARRIKPDRSHHDNARETIDLCRYLDGLPLALELAAARIKLFTPQAMQARLQRSLQWLTAGARDLPARQQTLRGAIEWSYSLLDNDAKALLATLGVFQGSFSLEASEAICNIDGAVDTIDLISILIDTACFQVHLRMKPFTCWGLFRIAPEKLEEYPEAEKSPATC